MENIVVGSEDSPIFEAIKILKSLPIFLHLRNKWSEFAYLLGTPSHDVKDLRNDMLVNKIELHDCLYAILENWQARLGVDATIGKLVEALEGMGIKDCREPLSSIPFAKYLLKTSFNWWELTPQVQEYIVSNASRQTGFEFKLENHQHIFSTLDCSILKELIRGEKVQLFRQSIPEDIPYYVPRRVAPRNIISNYIFNKKSDNDIFLFSNLEMPKLYVMAGKETTGYSRDNLEYCKVRFMVLNDPAHFDMICKRTKKNVHLLEKEGTLLKWKKSRGEIKVLQSCQFKAKVEGLREDLFKTVEGHLPVIISNSAGMGKSTLLGIIGRQILELNPEVHVTFIILPDFVRQIKDVSTYLEETLKHKIEMALQTNLCLNNLGREILRFKLTEDEKRLELLLDGFDEINSDDIQLAFDILSTMATFKSVRIWVTSRPQYLLQLEDTLNVLGFNILPFNRKEQIQFFVSYWSCSKKVDEINLKNFVQLCLDILNKRLSDRDKEITGIPLQCLMVGEVFEDYVELEEAEAILKSSIRSITDLYQRFIESKFAKFKKLHGLSDNQKTLLLQKHAKLSFELIFENSENVNQLFRSVPTSSYGMLNVGIVEDWSGVNQPPKFIHRSFAEYLIAWFLVETFTYGDNEEKSWSQDMIECFFLEVLQTYSESNYFENINLDHRHFSHSVVCHFLNSLLIELELKDNFLVTVNNTIREKLPSLEASVRKICNAAVRKNYWGIFSFLDRLTVFDEIDRDTFTNQFLKFSIEHGDIQIFEIALRRFEKNYEFSEHIKAEVLVKALNKGNLSITEFLLKTKGLDELVKVTTRPLLHSVVGFANNDVPTILEQRKDIIKVLLNENPSLLELTDDGGRTALVSKFVHFELIHELVKLGANFFAKGYFDQTVLHEPYAMSSDQLHKLLETMKDKNEGGLRELFQMKAMGEWKPFMLMFVAYNFNPLKETIKLAIKMKVNINELDCQGYSCLANAISYRSSLETIQTLSSLGADVNWKHNETLKTLVHLAASICNSKLLIYLLDNHKLGINDLDSDKDSPLDVVAYLIQPCKRNYPSAVECVMELIRRGGSAKKANLTCILHHAIVFGKQEVVKCLVVDRNIDIKEGKQTPMQILWKKIRLVETVLTWKHKLYFLHRIFLNLLDANADLEAEGIANQTLMHVLIQKYPRLDSALFHVFVKMLRKHNLCHLLSKRDKNGKTPLHIGIERVEIRVETLHILNNSGFNWGTASQTRCLLHSAISLRKCANFLKSLVAFGADLYKVDKNNNGLLQVCCKSPNKKAIYIDESENENILADTIQFLLGLGKLDVNLKNKKGQTPLHMAVLNYGGFKKAMVKIIAMLIRNGAEYGILDLEHEYETPFDSANPDEEVLHEMIKYSYNLLQD